MRFEDVTGRFALAREWLRGRVWLIPLLFVAGAIGLGALLIAIDRGLGQDVEGWFLYGGAAESARQLLGTIAAALITFTGLVFSITVLVLQQASSQFSPRVLRTFLQDRRNHVVLGIYISTFTFTMIVLAAVRGGAVNDGEFVPALSVSVALALVLVSLGAFVFHIDHIAHSIRAVTIIGRVAEETRDAIDRMYPAVVGHEATRRVDGPTGPPDLVLAHEGDPGVLANVDADEVISISTAAGSIVRIAPLVGDFVPTGAPLFEVWGDASRIERSRLEACVQIQAERTMHQDVAFGLRQLVDIAERGLSPAVNDPTTAVQAIDQLHDCLRRLAERPFPSEVRTDRYGDVRLVLRGPTWDDYVNLALQEIRQYGERSVQIARRLRSLIEDVADVAPPERRRVLATQLEALDETVERAFPERADRALAKEPDEQGLE